MSAKNDLHLSGGPIENHENRNNKKPAFRALDLGRRPRQKAGFHILI